MQERKRYEVALTSRQKSTLDKLLEIVWDDDCVELKEIKQYDETMKDEEFPQIGDTYYYYDEWGVSEDDFQEYNVDIKRVRIGNCFKTKEEAEFEMERSEVIAEMKKFAETKDREWYKDNVNHWCISYDYIHKIVTVCDHNFIKHADIYFETEEIANKCIDSVGKERIKKFYLRVKD